MGALHAGHAALVDEAKRRADKVVATIFVNPMQFDEEADLAAYPRDEARDLGLAEEAGVDVLFAPSADEMYPPGFQTWVEPGPLARPLCGERRPGHFRGVCTIVAKLFALSRADAAFFGEKDYQQLLVIQRMALDLNFGIEVIGRPTVREADGLAISSRNSYLNREERQRATALWKALQAARRKFAEGERDPARLEETFGASRSRPKECASTMPKCGIRSIWSGPRARTRPRASSWPLSSARRA